LVRCRLPDFFQCLLLLGRSLGGTNRSHLLCMAHKSFVDKHALPKVS
jgi:hypothetical protein